MIKTEHLTKRFPNGKGIFDINIEVDEGEVLGYIGPNGAGKSTTIRHLLGYIKPDSGHASIAGCDTWSQPVEAKKDLGYLPGEIEFPKGVSASDFLDMICSLKGATDPRAAWFPFAERMNLDIRVPIERMSKGNKQKVAIAATFACDPKTIILDEPSTGLDPLMQDELIALFVEAKNRGCTILLSSHIFEEVEAIADRITIVRQGKIVANERMDEVRKALKKSVHVTFSQAINAREFTHLQAENISPNEVSFKLKEEREIQSILNAIHGKDIVKLRTEEQTLRGYFRDAYKEVNNHE